jgi:hypothetical protein
MQYRTAKTMLSPARLELAALGFLLAESSHTWRYETHVITNYTKETLNSKSDNTNYFDGETGKMRDL